MNEDLAAALARMAAEDQRIREPPDDPEQFVRFLSMDEAMDHARIDVGNTDRLREIIAEHGWPGVSLVGEDGAEAAWLIAQHADRQLDFQREVLPLLTAAAANGEAKARHAAYLTDRICKAEGRPQVYGTQVGDIRDGRAIPWPIEDLESVDARRLAAGLEPLDDYLRDFVSPRPSP
jgi:hypothetical protein